MNFYGFADPSSVGLKKRSWLHLCSSGQQYDTFQALHKNSNCHSSPLSTWMDENV